MASIERTAYPRFRRIVPLRELHEVYEPSFDEVTWARDLARSSEHLLALAVLLKCFQRLGHFPKLGDVPEPIVAHVRGSLDLEEGVQAQHESERTRERHRELVRRRLGVVHDRHAPPRAGSARRGDRRGRPGFSGARSPSLRAGGEVDARGVGGAGGVERVSADHAAISAHHGNNYMPFLERYYRPYRSTLFGLLEALQLEATSADRSVLDAVEFIMANRHLNREHVPDQLNGKPLNLSFAGESWLRVVRDRHRPGQLRRGPS